MTSEQNTAQYSLLRLASKVSALGRRRKRHISGDAFASLVYELNRILKREHLNSCSIQNCFLKVSIGRRVYIYEIGSGNGHMTHLYPSMPDNGNFERVDGREHLISGSRKKRDTSVALQVTSDITESDPDFISGVQVLNNIILNSLVDSFKFEYLFDYNKFDPEIQQIESQARDELLLPGSVAINVVRRLPKWLSAKGCFFACVEGTKLHFEYAKKNMGKSRHRTTITGGRSVEVDSPSILDALHSQKDKHSFFRFAEIKETEFADYINEFLAGDVHASDGVLIAPVVFDGDTLAALILVFDSIASNMWQGSLQSIDRSVEVLRLPSRYLFQRRTRKLITDPIFSNRNSRIVEKQCFLMMPFSEPWSDNVAEIVRDELSSHGYDTIRADDLSGANLVEDIWTAILQSEFVVADSTGKNSNVYYELGVAHTLGKKTLLITQEIDDIPFDTRHLRHVIYSNDLKGHKKIQEGIAGFLAGS